MPFKLLDNDELVCSILIAKADAAILAPHLILNDLDILMNCSEAKENGEDNIYKIEVQTQSDCRAFTGLLWVYAQNMDFKVVKTVQEA